MVLPNRYTFSEYTTLEHAACVEELGRIITRSPAGAVVCVVVVDGDVDIAGDKRLSGRSGQRVSDHNGAVSPYYAPYPIGPGIPTHGARLLVLCQFALACFMRHSIICGLCGSLSGSAGTHCCARDRS